MADNPTNVAVLNPALEQFIRQKLVKQYNRSHTTAHLMPKEVGMGKNLAWDVSVGTATGQVFDDGQLVVDFNSDTEVLATLPWCEYGDALKITGRAEDGAQFSNTELGNTFMVKLEQARTRAAQKVNDDLWTGDGTGAPQKLTGIALAANGPLSGSGTYAGINRATFPQWAGITMANGGIPRAITLSDIEFGLEQVFNASGKIPTFGLTTSNIWRLLCELEGGSRRIMQEVYIRGQKLVMSLGFHAVEVNGIPVFKDISVPTGHLAFFSEDSIGIEFLPVAPARIARGKIMATAPLAGLPQEQDLTGAPAMTSLNALIIALPANGNFEAWQLVSTLGLKVPRPNANLLIKDIQFRAGN